MWYEILPPCVIIVAAMSIPVKLRHYVFQYVYDTPYLRQVYNDYEVKIYKRDENLTGDVYKINGLDAIPDEPAK